MRIFFIGSKKTETQLETSKKVMQVIEKFGHKIDKTQIKTTYAYETEHLEDAFKTNYNAIKKNDIVIVESTGISSGIGFLIATALNEKKPVLALNNSEINPNPSLTLQSAKSKYFTFSDYTFDTLDTILKSFFDKMKSKLDTKFILIISPEIERYLEWAADYRRMHKAQVVRQAIEEEMEKDKEYQASLKEDGLN